MKMTSFHELVEVMNLKTRYEEMISENKLSVPKKYKCLSTESANWCLDKIDVFNKKQSVVKDIKSLCLEYIERGADIRFASIIHDSELREVE